MNNDKTSIFILKLSAFCLSFSFIFHALLHFTSGSPFDESTDSVSAAIQAMVSDGTDLPTIIIDPGHGGIDGGASSDTGILEKDINLQISLYLAELCSVFGIPYELTRSSDTMLGDESGDGKRKMRDLKYRVSVTEKYSDCVFISIHQNKFPQKKYSGLQVYYSKNSTSSKMLADGIQNNTKLYLQPENSRQTKQADSNIYILDNVTCPAVLVECGFLSNDIEAEKLTRSEYQKYICTVIFSSVFNYINDNVAKG